MIRNYLLPALAALLLPLSGTAIAANQQAHPALWKLADSDTTIYLFGTFHLLPDGTLWRTPMIETAINSAETLVLEVGNLGDEAAIRRVFMRLATSPGVPPIRQRVKPGRQAALAKMIATVGTTEAFLDPLESWAVASIFEVGILHNIGLSTDNGVEAVLRRTFEARRKPVLGIETAEDQLLAFDSLSAKAQLSLLNAVLAESTNPRDDFEKMLAAWSRGDERGISASFDDELRSNPEIGTRLIKGRNANWVRWIKARMDRPGTILIAVGAGHLAGRDSVQRMLRKVGLKATRIQ